MHDIKSRLWGAADSATRGLVMSLEAFGLSTTEALVYIDLLRRGPSNGSNMASRLDERASRGEAYGVLQRLVEKNMVEQGSKYPAMYYPVDPSKALSTVLEERATELAMLKTKRDELVAGLIGVKQKGVDRPDDDPYMATLYYKTGIHNRIKLLIREAENIVYVIADKEQLTAIYHSEICDSVKGVTKQGKDIRLIVNESDSALLRSIGKDFGQIAVRASESQITGWILLEKGRQVMISLGSELNNGTVAGQRVLWTNSQNMLSNQLLLCEHLWESSRPITISARGKKGS